MVCAVFVGVVMQSVLFMFSCDAGLRRRLRCFVYDLPVYHAPKLSGGMSFFFLSFCLFEKQQKKNISLYLLKCHKTKPKHVSCRLLELCFETPHFPLLFLIFCKSLAPNQLIGLHLVTFIILCLFLGLDIFRPGLALLFSHILYKASFCPVVIPG